MARNQSQDLVVDEDGQQPTPPTLSTVQRRQERLRQTLYEQAGALFEEKGGEHGNGYEATTVEEIAARSDISTRTFFRHFESKADVIYLDLRKSTQEYFEALDRRLAVTDFFSAAVLARIDQIELFASEPLNVARLLRAMRSRHFVNRRAAWYADLQEKLQQRLLSHVPATQNAPVVAALAAALAVKVGEMGLLHWSAGDGKGHPAEAIAQVALWCQDLFGGNTKIRQVILEEKKIRLDSLVLNARKGKNDL